MKKIWMATLALMLLSLVACGNGGKDEGSSTPTSPTTTSTTTTLPNAPAFDCDRGVDVSFGRTTNATNKFSARVTCNVNAMLESPINDLNGAEMDMYVYAANGNRRKWTTAYANSVLNGRASTLWRDVDTDNAVKVVFQVYPYRSNTPVRATFPTQYRDYHRITEGISLRHNSTDGLMYLQGPLPAVSSTFSLDGLNSLLRVEDPNGVRTWLSEVAEMVDGVLTVICSGDCDAYREQ